MTRAHDLTRATTRLDSDIDAMGGIVGDVETLFNRVNLAIETPGTVAGTLQGIAAPLDVPEVVLAPLKLVPWGIGQAVKAFDHVTGHSVDEINAQADRLWDIDEKLLPHKDTFANIEKTFDYLGKSLKVVGTFTDEVAIEARMVETAIGAQALDGLELGIRVDTHIAALDPWNGARDAVTSATKAAIDAIGAAAGSIGDALPDLSLLTGAEALIDGAFGPIADALDMLDGLLNKSYTVVPAIIIPAVVTPGFWTPAIWPLPAIWVPPVTVTPEIRTPAVTVNPGAIMSTIGSAIGIVQHFIEDLILDALAAIGIDLLGAIDKLQDAILAPLRPVFDLIDDLLGAFDALKAKADAILADLTELFDEVVGLYDDIVASGNIFENRVEGSAGDDDLNGGTAEDGIFGLAGDDLIAAGPGDIAFGGAGDDTITGVDAEMFGGEGSDEIRVLGTGGGAAIGGDGDDTLVGGHGDDTLLGGDGRDSMTGKKGDDFMVGGGWIDTMRGGQGDDTIDGGAGRDIMVGGAGDDVYRVDNTLDRVIEVAGGGQDRVESAIDYALLTHSEDLTLTGGAMRGTGNAANNVIVGNDLDNVLAGGDGADILTGGAGADRFVFESGPLDVITDFAASEGDQLAFAVAGLGTGALDAASFHVGTAAADAADRVIYDAATGTISIDVDGSGEGAATAILRLDNLATLAAEDVLLT
jgi:Ca2+-binding RTX toxin-like protein